MSNSFRDVPNLVPFLILFAGMVAAYWWLGRGIDPVSGKSREKSNGQGWTVIWGFCLLSLVIGVALVWGRRGPTVLDRWQNSAKRMPSILPGKNLGEMGR